MGKVNLLEHNIKPGKLFVPTLLVTLNNQFWKKSSEKNKNFIKNLQFFLFFSKKRLILISGKIDLYFLIR